MRTASEMLIMLYFLFGWWRYKWVHLVIIHWTIYRTSVPRSRLSRLPDRSVWHTAGEQSPGAAQVQSATMEDLPLEGMNPSLTRSWSGGNDSDRNNMLSPEAWPGGMTSCEMRQLKQNIMMNLALASSPTWPRVSVCAGPGTGDATRQWAMSQAKQWGASWAGPPSGYKLWRKNE